MAFLFAFASGASVGEHVSAPNTRLPTFMKVFVFTPLKGMVLLAVNGPWRTPAQPSLIVLPVTLLPLPDAA